MSSSSQTNKEKQLKPFIITAAIAIPVLVTILAIIPKMDVLGGLNPYLLPMFNAIVNGTTFLVLIAAFLAIKNKNVVLHKRLMTAAIALSLVFLLSYVLFHASTEPTKFGGVGFMRSVYFFMLLTHILFAIVIVPLVLVSYVRAIAEKFDKHRRIARITLPIWLYVTLTGVFVYLMIAPYYPQ